MKKIILAFVFIILTTVSYAQNIGPAFGIKGGVNFASLKESGEDADDSEMKIGFHAGVFVNVPLGSTFAFQPELLYSTEGGKEEILNKDYKLNLTYLNLPLLLQYNASGFFAETGPQVGFLIGAKSKVEDEDGMDIKDSFETINLSWAVGLGLKTATGLGFGARYNLGLSNIAEGATGNNKLKGNVIQVSVFKTLGR